MQEWTLYDRTWRWGRLPLLGVGVDEAEDVVSMMTARLLLCALPAIFERAHEMRPI